MRNLTDRVHHGRKKLSTDRFHRTKPFTNALLHNQEITALIRDTEPHERGLFSVDPTIRHSNGQARANNHAHDTASRRRTTQLGGQGQSSAVARVLGNDMLRKIQSSNRDSSRGRGVDIEVLLQGAEKLCATFDVAGTTERVATLRDRHKQITTSIKYYEGKMSKQQSSLNRLDQTDIDDQANTDGLEHGNSHSEASQGVTGEDIEAEEEAIRELEDRKKTLESRVLGMEQDLGRLRD